MPGDGGGLESSSTAAKRRSILAGSGGGSGSPGRSRSNSAATEEETNMPIGGGKAAPMGGPARSDGGGAKVTIGITNATPHPAGSKLDLDQGLPTAKRATMCTLPRCDPENLQPGCWTTCTGTRFRCRVGPNYKKNKKKGPSKEALFELLGCDLFKCPKKIEHIATQLDLPEAPDGKRLFVLNAQLPGYAPANPVWGETADDGEGYSFVFYFAIPLDSLHADDSTMWKEFCTPGNNGNLDERFKAIAVIANPQDMDLGRAEKSLITSYNGQPVLTRPQHRFHFGDGYLEMDADVHQFGYLCRRGFSTLQSIFPKLEVDLGFVIEAWTDEELPEQILCCIKLNLVSLARDSHDFIVA